MPGVPDPVYILARRVLLDALEALGPQRNAIVLVGAQAVYLRTGETDLAVAPFTQDADVALDPNLLLDEPLLVAALERAGFQAGAQPGAWLSAQEVPVDLLVPAPLAGGGRRGADLGVHGKRAARKVAGLEGALVDRSLMTLQALDPSDLRAIEVHVAGPAALLVSKAHKISEREDQPGRLRDKDALDAYRLLDATATENLVQAFDRLLTENLSQAATARALSQLRTLFADRASPGIEMLVRAVTPFEDGEFRAQACMRLVKDLVEEIGKVD
jgi:hypothetical protein